MLPDPFLLIDGQGGRFDLPFLEYVNEPRHRWWTCVISPYGTNKWQVGGSPQQNGRFNIEMSKGKQETMAYKVKQ
jgi:hypothetical protein